MLWLSPEEEQHLGSEGKVTTPITLGTYQGDLRFIIDAAADEPHMTVGDEPAVYFPKGCRLPASISQHFIFVQDGSEAREAASVFGQLEEIIITRDAA